MTDSEKIKVIEDMGIDVLEYCPSSFGLRDISDGFCCISSEADVICPICWIKALEDKP